MTNCTEIRVPLTTGFPTRISGFSSIRSSQSIGRLLLSAQPTLSLFPIAPGAR